MKKENLLILGFCLLLAGCGKADADRQQDIGESAAQNGTAQIQTSALPNAPAVSEAGQGDMAQGGLEQSNPQQENSEQMTNLQDLLPLLEDYGDREIYEKLYALRTVPENPVNPEGTWNRTDVHSGQWGSLTISEVTGESFWVEGELGYYSHSGWFAETAYYVADNLALARYDSGMDGWAPEYVAFELQKDGVKVLATASSAQLGFGMNVSISGFYKQGEAVYTNANVLEEYFTEQNLADLKALLPESYYTDCFLFATENGVVCGSDTTLSNGHPVKCVEAFVPTMGYGYTLYFSEDGYYSITFDSGTSFLTDPAGAADKCD